MPSVLLVEDDQDLREMLQAELQLEGIDTVTAENALQCYKCLNSMQLDVLVLDIGLPDESGLEIARYARQNTHLGVILLTALGSANDRVAGYDAGADIYCVKPTSGKELALAINNLYARLQRQNRAVSLQQRPESQMQGNGIEGVHNNPVAWRFNTITWSLASPEGGNCQLSGKEKQFLDALTQSTGSPIKRDSLLETLNYPDNEYGRHALETLVLRLRKKLAKTTKKTVPIKTVRGIGYQFTAGLILD